MSSDAVRLLMVGCGDMARYHLKEILAYFPDTDIPVVCEPDREAFDKFVKELAEYNRAAPINDPDLSSLLAKHSSSLDAAFIVTPHALHHAQATACLEAGLDVLLEKPMVMTAAEAESLIETRDRTGRLLVVAFQGSLSPEVRKAAEMLRSGELGPILNVNALVWQNWAEGTDGTWRQRREEAGGGFLFYTGAHKLNTVADMVGEEFAEVAAWLDNQGRAVDILGVVMGRLESGALVTLNACGNTFPSCSSEVRVLTTKAMLRTGVWGRTLEIQYDENEGWQAIPVPQSTGVWEQFVAVRAGRIPNPSPPEIGHRMARLWDSIRRSAAQGGALVRCAPIR